MDPKSTFLFGFNVTFWPKWLILIVCIAGIMIAFLLQGMAQETLYVRYKFKDTIFFTFIQFFGYFLFSSKFFFDVLAKRATIRAPIRFYALASLFLCCSMLFSNMSVELLSYPTAVLFKSSKLIPVMIGGYLFLGKRYSFLEVLSIFLIVLGLIGVSLSDKYSNNQFNPYGVLLSTLSLSADAIASNLQEKAFEAHGASQLEVISTMYLLGSSLILIVAVFSGQLMHGISQCNQNPAMILYLFEFAFLGSIGVQFVYLLMKTFGSLLTVMVTSLRKGLTVCISFILFPEKQFTIFHLFSMFGIVLGITMNYFGKPKQYEKKGSEVADHHADQSLSQSIKSNRRRRNSLSVL